MAKFGQFQKGSSLLQAEQSPGRKLQLIVRIISTWCGEIKALRISQPSIIASHPMVVVHGQRQKRSPVVPLLGAGESM
jgi:hypothetical protein